MLQKKNVKKNNNKKGDFLNNIKTLFRFNYKVQKRKYKKRYKNTALPNGTFLSKGKYIIYQRISTGGYGYVYLAKDQEDNFCAIKEFLPNTFKCRENNDLKISFENEKEEKKFKHNLMNFYLEAENASHLQHPNIIKILDVFKENGTAYIVMPLEKGMSLFHYVKFFEKETGQKLPDHELKNIFIQTCHGLSFLHDNGYLHLDIKPGNIWIRPNGQITILDLGSSRHTEEINKQGTPASTIGYAAPEFYQIFKDEEGEEDFISHQTAKKSTDLVLFKEEDKTTNNKKLKTRSEAFSKRTDIYSLGAVLRFCLETDIPPHAIYRTVNKDSYYLDRISQFNPHFLKIVEKSMQINPENRYSNVEEILFELEKIKCPLDFCEEQSYTKKILNKNEKIY